MRSAPRTFARLACVLAVSLFAAPPQAGPVRASSGHEHGAAPVNAPAKVLLSARAEPGPKARPEPVKPSEIRYRALTAADFRAVRPPGELRDHGKQLRAASCLRIAWPAGIHVVFDRTADGRTRAELQSPRFHARFDPDCSWLAPDLQDVAYALAHEQVHFAISEAAARQLTGELRTRRVVGQGTGRHAALDALAAEMKRIAEEAMARAAREHGRVVTEAARRGKHASHRAWARAYRVKLGVGP